jgi:hypothetical protein
MRFRLLAAALLVSACVTTWKYQRIEGEVASIHPELWTEVKCTGQEARAGDGGCAAVFAPVVTCETNPSLCSQHLGGGAPVNCAGFEPLLSFVHLSDAKLREHAVIVSDDSSTEFPAALDQLYRNDDAVLLATVLGVNQLGFSGKPLGNCPAVGPPRFVIHTGNSVGLGLFSELTQFMAAMNELAVPWFNVVGANDVSFLGSRPNETVSGANAIVPYVPIGNVDRFMTFHAVRGVKTDVTLPNPAQRGRDDGPNQAGCRREASGLCSPDVRYPRSLFHGFNANCETADAGLTLLEKDRDGLCTGARGYYALNVPSNVPELSFRLIVLNTAENVIDDGTTGSTPGHMLMEQERWLKRELDGMSASTFALVFGHDRLDAFEDTQAAELKALLAGSPRVLGYFHGGDGDSLVTQRPDGGTRSFPEIGAASLLEYPQVARAVEVMRAKDGSLHVRVASFSQGQTREPFADSSPRVTGGECDVLSGNTSFCRRLGYRAARGFSASQQLVTNAPAVLSASQRNSNGFLLVYQPDGGSP